MEAFYTSSLTIITGVLVYVLGQIIIKFFVEPIYEQRKAIGDVLDMLIFYGIIYVNASNFDKQQHDEVAKAMREKSSLLRVRTYAIPHYDSLANLGIVLERKSIHAVCKSLNAISHDVYDKDPSMKMYEEAREAFKTLGFPSPDE